MHQLYQYTQAFEINSKIYDNIYTAKSIFTIFTNIYIFCMLPDSQLQSSMHNVEARINV